MVANIAIHRPSASDGLDQPHAHILQTLRCDRVLIMRHGAIVAEHAAGWSDNALVASIEGI